MTRSKLEDLVIISGFSGAGKTTAMNVFEDAGYFCVDNLPAEMISTLAELFMHPGSSVERAAVVSDLRGGTYFERLAEVIDQLGEAGIRRRVLFLCADPEALVTRYKETRRRHPLAQLGSVADGIKREAELLGPVQERSHTLIDTTGMSTAMLRRKVASEMLDPEEPGKLAVTLMSFGFKHGPARDADLLFDVRFLPNPHYEAELRPLTGYDQAVVDYVAGDGRLDEFYRRILPLLDFLLPQYVAEGKAHLAIAVGCTGGRHRSVAIVEELARRIGDDDRFALTVQHRDVERADVRSAG
jgi:UPF0042 nucleotide-binding protein